MRIWIKKLNPNLILNVQKPYINILNLPYLLHDISWHSAKSSHVSLSIVHPNASWYGP